jgi:hypothetical protein
LGGKILEKEKKIWMDKIQSKNYKLEVEVIYSQYVKEIQGILSEAETFLDFYSLENYLNKINEIKNFSESEINEISEFITESDTKFLKKDYQQRFIDIISEIDKELNIFGNITDGNAKEIFKIFLQNVIILKKTRYEATSSSVLVANYILLILRKLIKEKDFVKGMMMKGIIEGKKITPAIYKKYLLYI